MVGWFGGSVGGWVGVVSYMGECCCCYLEVSACCLMAYPHHTRQQREAVWGQFSNRNIPYKVYLRDVDRGAA